MQKSRAQELSLCLEAESILFMSLCELKQF